VGKKSRTSRGIEKSSIGAEREKGASILRVRVGAFPESLSSGGGFPAKSAMGVNPGEEYFMRAEGGRCVKFPRGEENVSPG